MVYIQFLVLTYIVELCSCIPKVKLFTIELTSLTSQLVCLRVYINLLILTKLVDCGSYIPIDVLFTIELTSLTTQFAYVSGLN